MAGKYPIWVVAIVVTGMLGFGTCTVVLQKTIFSIKGEGLNGDIHYFEKPWFQTEMMFLGMFGCLFVFEIKHVISLIRKKKNGDSSEENDSKKSSSLKTYLVVSIPAICDLSATALMNVGLLWIPASIWQMLRGSMTIFSAFFTKFFRKIHVYTYQWIGVAFVAFALVVVAFSCLMAPTKDPIIVEDVYGDYSEQGAVELYLQVIGICLVVGAQIIQSSQIVIEEALLKDANTDPVLIVGLEGMWGGLICSGICLTVVNYFIPSSAGSGVYENSVDTLYMLIKSPQILVLAAIYSAVILSYNLFGMYVTQVTSAVIRTILEGLRTACIWIVQLIIGLFVSEDSALGETWNDWSYLQLAGFFFLLEGLFIYNGHLRISCFDYSHLDNNEAKDKKPLLDGDDYDD
ncbi:Integral membrane protein [Entamoeba marina]